MSLSRQSIELLETSENEETEYIQLKHTKNTEKQMQITCPRWDKHKTTKPWFSHLLQHLARRL